MEPDLKIIVNGMSEEVGRHVGEALLSILNALSRLEEPLDFRRMHRVIVSADFAGELAELSRQTASGRPIEFTNEDYAVAVAKVLLLPRGSEIEIVPVFNASILTPLTGDPESANFKWILHVVHHEFCHVHDDNKKLDAMPGVFLHCHYSGKEVFLGPLAELCWSEYAATRLSSTTATQDAIELNTNSLAAALAQTKKRINTAILSYRINAELDELMKVFQRHGWFLIQSAAYVLGYIDGLGKPLEQLAPKAAETLKDSYFEASWLAIQAALREMWENYPHGWKDLTAYTQLRNCLEDYYAEMGLVLSTTEDGHAYVNIPFTPETTPRLGGFPWQL